VTLAIIGGTGFSALPDFSCRHQWQIATRCGSPSGPVLEGRLGGADLLFLGRHGSGPVIPPHRINYRANLLALQARGATRIIALNAVGGISPAMPPGTLVVCDQLIDYTWGREQTFFDGPEQPLQHVDFTWPYDPVLRSWLLAGAAGAGEQMLDAGVCGIVQGPRLETAAEISRLEKDGCDLVGMTGMPEAALARELGIPYVCLAMVVNPAAGRSASAITLGEIQAVMSGIIPRVIRILRHCCAA